jgi:hypothetical protein
MGNLRTIAEACDLDFDMILTDSAIRLERFPEELGPLALLSEILIKTNSRIKTLEKELECMKREKNS